MDDVVVVLLFDDVLLTDGIDDDVPLLPADRFIMAAEVAAPSVSIIIPFKLLVILDLLLLLILDVNDDDDDDVGGGGFPFHILLLPFEEDSRDDGDGAGDGGAGDANKLSDEFKLSLKVAS